MKIRTKILILIFCAYLITGIAAIFVGKTIATNIIKDQEKRHLIAIALSHTYYIESLLTDYKNITEVLSVGNPAKNIVDIEKDIMITKPAIDRRIKNTILSQKTISKIRILNTNGIVLSTSDSDTGMDQSKEDIFINGMQNSYISDVHISRFTDKLVLSVSTPIIVDSVISGVCIVNFDVEEEFFKITTNRIGLGNTGKIYLLNENGMMITPSRFIPDAVLNQKVEIEHTAHCVYVLPDKPAIQQPNISYCNSYTGYKVLRVHVHIPEVEWSLVVEMNEDEAFAPVKKLISGLVLMFMLLFVIGIIVALILANAISKPIIKLKNGIDEIKRGNLEYKVATKSKDEIGQLSRAFDEMTARLMKSRRELETHAGKLEEQVKDRTKELNKQFDKSEQQRQAIANIATDLDETIQDLQLEIIERKNSEQIQKVFYNISNALNTTNKIRDLYSKIREYLGEIIDTTNFYIALYDEKTDMISLPFDVDEKDDYETFPVGKTLTSLVIKTGKPLFVNKQLQDELTKQGKIEIIGTPSEIWLGVPLIIKDKVIGVMAVQSYNDPNLYTEKDVEIFTFASEEIALAIMHKEAEELILKNLKEKETLLRELYHRTKNNMQIISSMLRMQSRSIENRSLTGGSNIDFMHDSFNDVINKIKAMSLVHQKLYQAEDLSHINLKEYVKDLVNLLMISYGIRSESISLKLDLKDVFVLIDSAIPLGLVLNELISNMFKHAFPNDENDEISIRLFQDEDGIINIHLSDNGAGIPADIELENVNTMGLQTVFDLIKYQLKGKVTYKTENGLKWHIRLKDNMYSKRV